MDNNLAALQVKIYTKKFFRTLKRESIVSIIIGIIITILVMYVTRENMFENYEGTKSGFFSLICACIWIGIFNSIQLVCREKNDIVKDELDKSLKATSYMSAHFIYQFFLCLIQSVIVFVIFAIFTAGKMEGSPLSYLITIFLITFASDAMAFVISSAVPNPIVAMTIMPLVLLIQLVMAGVLFELEGFAKIIANFTVSKWGMSAFGKIGDITSFPSRMEDTISDEVEKEATKAVNVKFEDYGLPEVDEKEMGFDFDFNFVSDADKEMFRGEFGEIFLCWLILIAFVVVFYFISVAALKMTTRRMKK